jgi:CheY-like chemotaxis protein
MGGKILVIDDDPVTIKYLVRLFEDNGYQTVQAKDGTEGYEKLQEHRPDLITLDLDMPQDYGTKFYRRIRKDEQYKDTPIIVISGVPRSGVEIKKAVASLNKPFDPNKLLGIVRETIGPGDTEAPAAVPDEKQYSKLWPDNKPVED